MSLNSASMFLDCRPSCPTNHHGCFWSEKSIIFAIDTDLSGSDDATTQLLCGWN
jgi:hypothetical protein